MSAENPVQVLDIFESNFITTNAEQNAEPREVFIEELCMVLYFLKSAIRNLTDEEGKNLIAGDYRANLLIQLIFDKYGKTDVDIAYQISTILSLSVLTQFYGLKISDDQKDKLVDTLQSPQA